MSTTKSVCIKQSPNDIPRDRRHFNTQGLSFGEADTEDLSYLKVVLSEAPLVVHHQVQPLSACREYVVLKRHRPGSVP